MTVSAIRPDEPPANSGETDEPSAEAKPSIGSLMVDLGRLTPVEVAEIQRVASERGMKFGDVAVMLNYLSPEDIRSSLAQQYNYSLLARGGTTGVSDEVIAAYSPQSDGVESMRALRSQLMFGWMRDSKRRALTIVSPERGEGRSWLAANLATLFAQAGFRTLLIDADMRSARQHELFNVANSPGLAAMLAGQADSDAMHKVHEKLRLFLIPAGAPVPNPQELLSRPFFGALLEQYTKQFDLVLIDTPAVSESSDAQIAAAHAGSALMVVRRHHTRRAKLRSAARSISQARAALIGSVVSDH